MKKWLQKNIVYFIAVIILVTLSIQAYWNIKNYESNKVTVNNEVLAALNNSVDAYYTNLAKTDIKSSMGHESITNGQELQQNLQSVIDSVLLNIDLSEGMITTEPDKGEIIHIIDTNYTGKTPSIDFTEMLDKAKASTSASASASASGTITLPKTDNSQGMTTLATKVIISLSLDTINFKQLTAYLNDELKQKGLGFNYALSHEQKYQNPIFTIILKIPILSFRHYQNRLIFRQGQI